jgi:hypothetical protein
MRLGVFDLVPATHLLHTPNPLARTARCLAPVANNVKWNFLSHPYVIAISFLPS